MNEKICVKCGSKNCIGFVLFHPKELNRVEKVKQRELKKNSNAKFKLIRSTDRNGNFDGCFTKFMELHVIIESEDEDETRN